MVKILIKLGWFNDKIATKIVDLVDYNEKLLIQKQIHSMLMKELRLKWCLTTNREDFDAFTASEFLTHTKEEELLLLTDKAKQLWQKQLPFSEFYNSIMFLVIHIWKKNHGATK